jgi:hypothetical protein
MCYRPPPDPQPGGAAGITMTAFRPGRSDVRESPARQAIFARRTGLFTARNTAFPNAVTASTLIAFPGIRRPADGLSQV